MFYLGTICPYVYFKFKLIILSHSPKCKWEVGEKVIKKVGEKVALFSPRNTKMADKKVGIKVVLKVAVLIIIKCLSETYK